MPEVVNILIPGSDGERPAVALRHRQYPAPPRPNHDLHSPPAEAAARARDPLGVSGSPVLGRSTTSIGGIVLGRADQKRVEGGFDLGHRLRRIGHRGQALAQAVLAEAIRLAASLGDAVGVEDELIARATAPAQ